MKRVLSFLKVYRVGVVTLLLVIMIEDILLVGFKSDLITFSILGLIIFFFRFYKTTSKRIFSLAFIPIIVMFLMYFIDAFSVITEKAAIWLFLLMGVGIMQELFKKTENETI